MTPLSTNLSSKASADCAQAFRPLKAEAAAPAARAANLRVVFFIDLCVLRRTTRRLGRKSYEQVEELLRNGNVARNLTSSLSVFREAPRGRILRSMSRQLVWTGTLLRMPTFLCNRVERRFRDGMRHAASGTFWRRSP